MTNYWKLVRDIEIVQGATWQASLRYLTKCSVGRKPVPVDLGGYTAKMVIRECAVDSAFMIELLSTAGSGDSGIVLGGATGEIELNITATDTGSKLTSGSGVYELELINGSTVIAFATGRANVHQDIIR